MNMFSAILLSLLPKRYRDHFTHFAIPDGAVVTSGFLQGFLSLGLLFADYHAFMTARLASIPVETMEKVAEKGGESAVMGFGGFFMMEYMLRLTTILLIYFLLEGLVRVIAAIAASEAVPTLPFEVARSRRRPSQREELRKKDGHQNSGRSPTGWQRPRSADCQLPPQALDKAHRNLSRRSVLRACLGEQVDRAAPLRLPPSQKAAHSCHPRHLRLRPR